MHNPELIERYEDIMVDEAVDAVNHWEQKLEEEIIQDHKKRCISRAEVVVNYREHCWPEISSIVIFCVTCGRIGIER